MHPDHWSVTPFYDGFALMGTPQAKTFTRPLTSRAGTPVPPVPKPSAARRPAATITLRDLLYVIVISSGKNLAKMRDYCSTKLDRIGQHTLVSPRNWSALARDGFASPLPGCGEVMKAFF
ncbi:hypothetical protein [Nonomuraea coxensis]|uniref:hypothetical protein n=1 Tax=Nonomuraea coxensis TaxID=404386 RepID=UPI0012F7D08C|nr:hypothetical protein [Nonomuraea coxensis]